jgi:O-methyltransferase
VDSDLFSSALFVLIHMGPYLRPNDIIIFDEFHVWMDEFRAFKLFLKVYPFEYKALFRSPDWSQTVLEITSG